MWRSSFPLVAIAAITACGGNSEPFAVVIGPASPVVIVDGTTTLEAHVLNINGDTLAGVLVTWTSDDITIATVSSNGTVSGVAFGSTSIIATAGGAVGTATLNVVPTVTGYWEGLIPGGAIVALSIVEAADGSLSGSGTFTIPGQSVAVGVGGLHQHPVVRVFMRPVGFLSVQFEAEFTSEDRLEGHVRDSGFNGEFMSLTRR